MKPASNKPAAKSAPMRKSLSRSLARQRFRHMVFESLEGRSLLAAVDISPATWAATPFVNNEVMVRFNDNVTKDQAAAELFSKQGATIKQYWPELHLAEVKFPFTFTSPSVQTAAIQAIHNWTSVYYAEPNFIHQSELTPNDPAMPVKWDLNNTGQAVNPPTGLLPGTPGADIDALRAWDLTQGNSNTVIAIVDTGVDYNHPDLMANIWRNPGEIADGIDNDGNGFIDDLRGWDFADGDSDPDDTDGHGTHVAGIAAAVGNNGIGTVGVSWNSKIMPIRAGNPNFTSASIAGAQLYIAKMKSQYGINIVSSNNSYGSISTFSFTEFSAIQTSINAGVVFVCSAGNATNNNDAIPHYPSSYNLNGIIAVASTDNNDQLSTFSNYGQTSVDLAAPGEEILSTVPPFFNPPLNYDYLSGTSMASPHVAGAVALLKSYDPSLTVDEVKSLLLQGTDKFLSLSTKVNSSGRLNVANSLNLVPAGEIQGSVFEDANGNTTRDAGEKGLPVWTVYVDRNNNGTFDAGEPSTVTRADGSFGIRGVFTPGTYVVREVLKPNYTQTFPTLNAGVSVTLISKTSVVSNVNFGVKQIPGEIHGRKWNDLNGDGVMDATEPGIQGVVIYVDMNNDGKIAIGEPAAVTDSNGYYTILNVPPGNYNVREVYQPGYIQVFPDPAGATLGANAVLVTSGTTAGINFGNKAAFDYGDAPAPYPTLTSQNGAVHGILQGFTLGTKVDAETNGQPSVGAIGDNFAGNELQTVTLGGIIPTSGTFTLTYSGKTTAPIAYNASAATVRSALQALSNVGTGQIAVTGGPGPNTPWVVTFQGTLAGKNVPQMTANAALLVPTGGTITIATPQNGGINDEDGVVLSGLIPGQTPIPGSLNSATVTVQTGSFAAGYLQGFIDFNQNGNWNDPGEQIFKDVQLTTGTYELTFPVPASAKLGLTYARFRWSLDRGIGPTGSALGGEVEDYTANVLSNNPVAVNDAFAVDSGSFLFDSTNVLNVLANDFGSANGPAGIYAATAPTISTRGGIVQLDQNGTPGDPTDDFFRYQPPANFADDTDTFQYQDIDPLGNLSALATVSIFVRFSPKDPVAVDNTYDVLLRSSSAAPSTVLGNLLANDIQGTAPGTLHVQSNTSPAHGGLVVNSNGTATYTADVGYQGSDSFSYTIADSLGAVSTASVTLQVLSAPRTPYVGTSPAIIKFELQVVDETTGLVFPDGALIPLGTPIMVRGVVTDLRGPVIFPNPGGADYAGAFAAYMDLLYDRTKVQPLGQITFGAQFQDAKSGAGGTPGLIDEAGAAYSGTQTSSGSSPILVFAKEFLTTATGPLQFVANPADMSPSHDILAFIVDGGDPNFFLQPVPSTKVYYQASFPNISIIGAGEGSDTNLLAPADVNLDGHVSPIDALLVVNYLNEHTDSAANGEGSQVTYKRDVNHDDQISPIDALMVINALNRAKSSAPAAPAGEGEADDAVRLSPIVVSSTGLGSSGSTGPSTNSAAEVRAVATYASNVDQIFGQTDWTKPSVSRTEDSPWSKPAVAAEDLFAGLGTFVRRNRKG